MKQHRTRFLMSLMAVLLCGSMLMVSSCNTSKIIAIGTTQPLTTLRVAVQQYYLSTQIGYIIDEGLDVQHGIRLEPVLYVSGSEQNADITSGKYDVATTGGAFIFALAADQAVVIGEHINSTGGASVYVRPDSDILAVKGFNPTYPGLYGDSHTVKGKTIMMMAGTTSEYIGVRWLESVGVHEEDVDIRYGSFADNYERFVQGEGDIVALTAPHSLMAEQAGYLRVGSTDTLHTDLYEVLIATRQAYEAMPETLITFVQLVLMANEALENNFTKKVEYCKRWYESCGMQTSLDLIRLECRQKIFVTRENYDLDTFGTFEIRYAEFLAAVGRLDAQSLQTVRKNVDKHIFSEALRRL